MGHCRCPNQGYPATCIPVLPGIFPSKSSSVQTPPWGRNFDPRKCGTVAPVSGTVPRAADGYVGRHEIAVSTFSQDCRRTQHWVPRRPGHFVRRRHGQDSSDQAPSRWRPRSRSNPDEFVCCSQRIWSGGTARWVCHMPRRLILLRPSPPLSTAELRASPLVDSLAIWPSPLQNWPNPLGAMKHRPGRNMYDATGQRHIPAIDSPRSERAARGREPRTSAAGSDRKQNGECADIGLLSERAHRPGERKRKIGLANPRLFPHADGSATSYVPFIKAFSADIKSDSSPVSGQHDRGHAQLESIRALADDIFTTMVPSPEADGEVAFFGHSMRGLVAFGVA